MKKITTYISTVLLFISLQSQAEEMYLPELENLFGSDLVVDASYKRTDGPDYFYIQINEVLKGEKYGLKKGEYLRLKQLKTDGCGFPYVHHARRRNRYYLKKNEHSWAIRYSSTQSITELTHFDGITNLNDDGEPVSLNNNIKEFLTCYAYNKENRQYEVLKNEAQIAELSKHNVLVAQFEKAQRIGLGGILLEESIPEPIVSTKDTALVYCNFLDKPAASKQTSQEQSDYLTKNENPLSESGIEGKVILKALIDKEGKPSAIEILRSLHPMLDSLAIEKINSMPAWQPGQDHSGQTRACFYNIPVVFRIEETQ